MAPAALLLNRIEFTAVVPAKSLLATYAELPPYLEAQKDTFARELAQGEETHG